MEQIPDERNAMDVWRLNPRDTEFSEDIMLYFSLSSGTL